jgi:gamma-glutamyltranspeptidase / glutathione hydrolase
VPRICVAGPSRVVTDAAVEVGHQGGSVTDVAIVAALTAMCTEPGVCAPGGGGFMTFDLAGDDPVVIDGYMNFSGEGFNGQPTVEEVSMPYGGGVTTLIGAGSVAVPGAFAAFEVASRRYGRAPWSQLMDAVAETVAAGFPMSASCHRYLSEGAATIFAQDPVSRRALLDGEDPKPPGALVLFDDLAETLWHIGEEGPSTYYHGDLARVIVSDLQARGGQLTMEDMRSYRAIVREPLQRRSAGWRLGFNPAPAVGGIRVASVHDHLSGSTNPIDLAMALIAALQESRSASPSTISVAAADDEGGVVAASFSAGYGSGVVPEGTGMLMNNSLGELELTDGHGKPGSRMPSNMAPTVARRGIDAVAIGSPGADRITTAVATTLTRLIAGDDLDDAIDHPRAHPEFVDTGLRLAVEPGLDLTGVELPLRTFPARHMYFGGVNGAGLVNGELVAHADARRTGSVGFTTH